MTHVITQNCCNDASCVSVCPVNCIHPTPGEPGFATAEMLYIDPDSCIDCGVCVDACPVGAIDPDFDMAQRSVKFEELNARYFLDPANRNYSPTPDRKSVPNRPPLRDETLRVAIIGSGPAANYAAEELLSQPGCATTVDMFERLPVPWGLVRHGVAPDHEQTKAVTKEYSRTFGREGFRLFLNVEIGTTITHRDLARHYHAVIYAVGAMADRPLDIPGDSLTGSHSATEFVAWYNGHPDYADMNFDLSGERAVVIGNGNVALDVARILLSDISTLQRSDIADHALAELAKSNVREVVVVGRRGPAQAAFSTAELLGLASAPGIDLRTEPPESEIDDQMWETLGSQEHSIVRYKANLISEFGARPEENDRRIVMRFLMSPKEIVGDNRVESIRFVRNELVVKQKQVSAIETGAIEELPCSLVLRAVGYRGEPLPELPFDHVRGVLPNLRGRVLTPETGSPIAGVYAAGWIKRGSTGVIGTNKQCARETVKVLIEDWFAGKLPALTASVDVAEQLPGRLDLEGWMAIDNVETKAGRAASRPRVKIVDRAKMLEVARGVVGS